MTVREFLDAFGRCTSEGWLTWEEAALLVAAASETRGTLVEFGSYMGRSAMLLAQLGRPLVCVDPWGDDCNDSMSGDAVLRQFTVNVARLGLPEGSVAWRRCRVEDWRPMAAGFVYCDGDHSREGTLAQIDKALACQPQAVAIHDIDERGGGAVVREAALERLGPWDERAGRLCVWRLS